MHLTLVWFKTAFILTDIYLKMTASKFCIFVLLVASCFEHCNAQTFLLQEYQGFSFGRISSCPNALNASVPSGRQCAMLCASLSSSQCIAAQYNSVSKQCVFISPAFNNTLISPRPIDSNSTVYWNTANVYETLVADIFLPLSATCPQSYTDNYGSQSVDNVTLYGTFPPINNYSTNFLHDLLYWPTLSSKASSPVNYVIVTDSSPPYSLDIFGGDFTVSFLSFTSSLNINSFPDQTFIEFLGPTEGQVCYAIRFGCAAACVQFKVTVNCSTSSQLAANAVTISTFTNVWMHFTVVYQRSLQTFSYYVNAALSGTTTNVLVTTQPVPITRMNIGGTDSPGWTTQYNSHIGVIACVQLYSRALNATEVTKNYRRCADNRLLSYL